MISRWGLRFCPLTAFPRYVPVPWCPGVLYNPGMTLVTIDFQGATIIKHRNGSACVWIVRDPVDLPIRVLNGRFDSGNYLLVPVSGRGKLRRFYRSVAWVFGRPGR